MVTIKNSDEIKSIKKSCKILSEVKNILFDKMQAGISGIELDKIAEEEIIKRDAIPAFKGYQGFKNTICLSFNEEMIHGIPSKRKLKNKDLVKLDIGCVYEGMYSDSAFTKAIGVASSEDKLLIKVAKESFEAGLAAISKGSRVGDVSAAVWGVVKSYGMFVPENFSGHGIGYELHEDPFVFNKAEPGTGILLKDGMVICIEPMILQGSKNVKILKDGWTVVAESGLKSSHYEHTVLIQGGKGIVLSKGI